MNKDEFEQAMKEVAVKKNLYDGVGRPAGEHQYVTYYEPRYKIVPIRFRKEDNWMIADKEWKPIISVQETVASSQEPPPYEDHSNRKFSVKASNLKKIAEKERREKEREQAHLESVISDERRTELMEQIRQHGHTVTFNETGIEARAMANTPIRTPKGIMTPNEAAKVFDMQRQTVYRKIRDKKPGWERLDE